MNKYTKCLAAIGLLFALGVGSASTVKADRYVLLIGVGKYEHHSVPTLLYDEKDVRELQKAFIKNANYPADHVIVMSTDIDKNHDPNHLYANSDNVLDQLRTYLPKLLKEEDTIFLYFSGHGVIREGKQYLLTADSDLEHLDRHAVSLDELQDALGRIQAKTQVVILDACRNDPVPPNEVALVKDDPRSKGLTVDGSILIERKPLNVDRQMIFACHLGQVSCVFPSGPQNSVFSYYMIEGIRNAAGTKGKHLALDALYDYVYNGVTKWAQDNNHLQAPYKTGGVGKPIVVSEDVHTTLPSKLEIKGLEPDVHVDVAPQKYDPTRGAIELDNESEPGKIILSRPGFKTQILPVIFKSEATVKAAASPWEPDNNYRIRFVLQPVPGDQWGKLEFDSKVTYLPDIRDVDNNKKPVVLRPEKSFAKSFDVRFKQMTFLLGENSVKFSVSVTKKGGKHIVYGPESLHGGQNYLVKLDNDQIITVKPLETVFLKPPSEPGIKVYALPLGMAYKVIRANDGIQVTVNNEKQQPWTSPSPVPLTMGLEEEKSFRILYESGGKINRRIAHVTKDDSRKGIENPTPGNAAFVEFPFRDDNAPTIFDLSALPADAKATVIVEGEKYSSNSADNRILSIDKLESSNAEALISIDSPEFSPGNFSVPLTLGQRQTLKKEDFEPRLISAFPVEILSDPPGVLSIIAVDGAAPHDLLKPNVLPPLSKGTKRHLTLNQPGYYVQEWDIVVSPDTRSFHVPMVKHALKTPDEVLVRKNTKDDADMILIPGGSYKIGVANPDKRNEQAIASANGGYWIYAYPVTVGQYFTYCKEKGKSPDKHPKEWNANSRLPMTGITSEEAAEYAAWAGGSLPEESEWEIAARGHSSSVYPWGDKWDAQTANAWRYALERGAGSNPENHSPFGVCDIWGHVREWTSGADGVIIRGSSINTSKQSKTARLTWRAKDASAEDIGFRVVIKEAVQH